MKLRPIGQIVTTLEVVFCVVVLSTFVQYCAVTLLPSLSYSQFGDCDLRDLLEVRVC